MANPIIVPAIIPVTIDNATLYSTQAVDLQVTVFPLPAAYDMMVILQLYFVTTGEYGFFAKKKLNGSTSVVFDIETPVPAGTTDITLITPTQIINTAFSDVRYYYLFT